jgi:hypothetical protein
MMDARQLVDTMKKILLATVTILAFTAPSFAAEPEKTVGQAPASGASSFYLTQDTATSNEVTARVRGVGLSLRQND